MLERLLLTLPLLNLVLLWATRSAPSREWLAQLLLDLVHLLLILLNVHGRQTLPSPGLQRIHNELDTVDERFVELA